MDGSNIRVAQAGASRARRAPSAPSEPSASSEPSAKSSAPKRRSTARPFVDMAAAKQIARAVFRHPTPRRLSVLATYAAMWSVGRGSSLALQLVDEVAFPEWRTQKVEAPVFIFANPRSGTTMLHRLLSFDETNWVGPKLYETVWPSVTLLRSVSALSALDERIPGRPFSRLVDGFNALFVGDKWDGVHALGIDQPEEDEPSFVYGMHTPTTMLMVPHVEELLESFHFDSLPESTRHGFMDSYEGVLQRLVFARGGERRFLNKNVFFAPRVRSMAERFPDARFVYLVRHPYEAMPSFLNMFFRAWAFHSPEVPQDGELVAKLAEVGYEYYRLGLRLLETMPRDRLHLVRYDELVEDPKATVLDLYRWLDVDVSPDFERKLDDALAAQRMHESVRDYTLESFGLTKDSVYEALSDVFERFDFER